MACPERKHAYWTVVQCGQFGRFDHCGQFSEQVSYKWRSLVVLMFGKASCCSHGCSDIPTFCTLN